jgi:predicted glycogen debranching enzyme
MGIYGTNWTASTEQRDVAQVAEFRVAEIKRRKDVAASSPIDDSFARALASAADQYIVSRGDQKTVIAGYHWFGDWGRDTMIALPGLTLPTGKHDVARSILRTFAQHVDRGMLPNRFPDAGEAPSTTPSTRRFGSLKPLALMLLTLAIWTLCARSSIRSSSTLSPGTYGALATESR